MGWAGNVDPSFVLPSAIATPAGGGVGAPGASALADLDYLIGSEALATQGTGEYKVSYPMGQGVVKDWDAMERYWSQTLFKYMRCDPEDHHVLLTEPPMNAPENRELTAEIMFESFGVKGLYIGVQAVLALVASYSMGGQGGAKGGGAEALTGTVVDSGDGVTHVIPVADGYVIGSGIKSIPMAGRTLTHFVRDCLKERGEPVPPEDTLEAARTIKEQYCYTCSDMSKEFGRHHANPAKYVKQHSGVSSRLKKPWTCDVGYERFLAPELFFNPEIFDHEWATPLPEIVDKVIMQSPIDVRRRLYGNVVLSGGTTMFKDFGRRLERDISRRVQGRAQDRVREGKGAGAAVGVKVHSHAMQRYAVWFGGSVLASMPGFTSSCHTKAQYEEYGPSICRRNVVFNQI